MAPETAGARAPRWARRACQLTLMTLACVGTARAAEPESTPAAATAQPLQASDGAPHEPAGDADAGSLDLDALRAELSAAGISSSESGEPKLSLYGFTDFSFTAQVGKVSPIVNWYPTFAIGNLNLYLSTEFKQNWRSLVEVRFLYLPHGEVPAAGIYDPAAIRSDNSVGDYADVNRPLRWGGIEIERVWLEYTLDNLLTVRVGQWLTPYGIWNVDHGSPTIVGVFRPYIVGESLFPERQTGIEAYGSLYVDTTQLGYHVTLSNGRGPIDAYQDLDHNKALGARLFLHNESLLGALNLGLSGYRGTYSDRPDNPIRLDPVDGITLSKVLTARYRELALAADLKWEWEGALFQGELIVADLAYTDRLRPVGLPLPGLPPSFVPDARRRGYYVLAGYRTPWWNIMPFVVWQVYENPLLVDVREVQLGLNARVVSEVALKAEFIHVWFPGTPTADIDFVTTQVAWSF